MSIKLSQLMSDEIRVKIPVYIGEELIDYIKIINPTKEFASEIEHCIKNGQVNDGLRYKILKECSDLDLDVELDDKFYERYSELFERVMIEIDSIIQDIQMNIAIELFKQNKINDDKEKVEAMSFLINNVDKAYKQTEEQLAKIEKDNEKERIKKQIEELQKQLES